VAELNEGETLAEQVRTAAVVMVSQGVCERVAEALDLSMRWGFDRETVIRMSKEVASAEVIPDTTLIGIRTRYTDAGDASDVTMEIAKAYRDRLQEIEESRIDLEPYGLKRHYGNPEAEAKQLSKRLDVDAPDGVIRGEVADIEAVMARISEEMERLKLRGEVPVKRVVFHEQPTLARAPVEPSVPRISRVGRSLDWWWAWGSVGGSVAW
jgi:hypothetical protein